MKAIKVKDLNQPQILYNATKYFSNGGNSPSLGFWVIKAVMTCCGFDTVVNDYRRAYAIASALEKSDNDEAFIRRCLNDTYESNLKQAETYVESIVDLDYEDRATVERFLQNLCPDVYDETGARQTLID